MRMVSQFALLSLLGLMVAPSFSKAETIEFSEDELATESVMPVFDKTVVVRERTVKTAKRIEFGGGVGLNLAEPLYDQTVFNLVGAFHFDEINGMNLISMFLGTQLSSAGTDLKNGKGLDQTAGPLTYDASRAPTVQNITFANYQFTAYYGKISLSKDINMNLSLYGFGGLGMVKWTDVSKIGVDAGFGQKLYFTPNSALRFDMLLGIYQGPDPTNPNTTNHYLQTGGGPLGSSSFATTTYFRPFMTFGYVYLF